MQQYFIDKEIMIGNAIVLDKEQSFHISKVMRFKENDKIRVANNVTLAIATISFDFNNVVVTPIELLENISEFSNKITIVQAFIKGDRWDMVIQKAAELGCHTFVPLQTSRTVVRINDKINQKMVRFNKIAMEASEQSQRFTCMKVENPIDLKDIKAVLTDINLVAYEKSEVSKRELKDLVKPGKDITIIIGPEGGFSLSEIEYLNELGVECCSLGKRILRAETATMYALSVLDTLIG